MKLIAHRGNLTGAQPSHENHPDYINEAIVNGFDAEIDVWIKKGLYLGHDEPQYKCSISFLLTHAAKLWIHCKNLRALETLIDIPDLNIFWHQEDNFTLTSKGFIWTYPHQAIGPRSVLVVDNALAYAGASPYGLCADTLTT